MFLFLIPQTLPRPVAQFPVEISGHHLYIKPMINGKGPYRFIFDSGASATVVNEDRTAPMALTSSGTIPAGGAGAKQLMATVHPMVNIALGGTESAQSMYGLPLSLLEQAAGRQVDGVLGFDFFGKYVVDIDYANALIRLHDPARYAYSGNGETLPIKLVNNHVRVKAQVSSTGGPPVEGWFTIDTGAGNGITLARPFVDSNNLLTNEQKKMATIPIGLGVGGPILGIHSRLGEFRLGAAVLSSPVTAFSKDQGGYFAGQDLAGTIGFEVLKRFRVVINYPKREITFEKNASFDLPDKTGFAGLRLECDPPAFRPIRVREVWAGTAAESAGLQAGDVILEANGRRADALTMDDLQKMLSDEGSHVRMMIERGANKKQVELVVAKVR